jgi:hypothetical protein
MSVVWFYFQIQTLFLFSNELIWHLYRIWIILHTVCPTKFTFVKI